MRTPAADSSVFRNVGFGLLLIGLLAVPTFAGFAIAGTSETVESPVEDAASFSDSAGTAQDAPVAQAPPVISQTPLGRVPESAEDALTRRASEFSGVPRLQYRLGNSSDLRLGNGETIPLGDGLQLAVTVAPYPADDFDVDVEYALSRDGEPATDATVDISWDMVFMSHGPFETVMPHTGGGRYEGSYNFFMFGPWELQTTVSVPGSDAIDLAVSIYVWPTG